MQRWAASDSPCLARVVGHVVGLTSAFVVPHGCVVADQPRHSFVAEAIASSDYRRMSKGVVCRATVGRSRDAYLGHNELVAAFTR